ncbi:MAG: hypothetical protein QGH40_04980, partial [bacterium]|nr:hypothetical protein [bacterium]
YSLGALLYELLTLQRPFTGNDPWTVLEKVVKEDPVPLSKRVKGQRFSPELDSIVLKCMEKKKENRYESVMDLKREIELYLSGRPIGAMEYSLWQVFVKWMARNRVLAAASLAVVFVLVTAFAVSYVRISKSNQEAIMQREEAENNMLKAEVRLAMVSEEKRETGEAIRKYREIRRTMVERKNAVYPFIDLKLWKARHAEGRYKEVKNTLQMKTTAAGEPSKEIAAGAVCLDISPDGKTLAVGCSDGTVELWDTQTGGLIEQLEGHFKIVSSLVFSRDGTKLATGDLNLTIRIFSTDQWQQVAEFQGTEIPSPGLFLNKAIISLDFSPDGKTLASVNVGERGIFIWDLEKGNADGTYALKKKLKGHFRAVFSVNYSPDGTYLASASRDEWVWLWEVKNDYQGAKITGHLEDVLRVVFSPDGNLVASASQDSTIKIWDIHRGQEYTTFRGHGSPVTSIDFSPDGKILISGSMDRTVRFWDINRGEEISSYKVPDALVTSVAFSPDGQTAFSSFSDGR